MTYCELVEILNTSSREDWLFNDERGTYAYKGNLDLRIVRRDIDFDNDGFEGEEWATKHPNPKAYREVFEIYYGSTFVDEKLLVVVDGGGARLPLPKIQSNEVLESDYTFACLVDQSGRLDEYMDRAGLRVKV